MTTTDYGLPTVAAIQGNWNALSFFPDHHATAAIDSARNMLEKFRAFVDKIAQEGGAIDADSEFETYRQRCVSLFRRAWATEGGCMSSFITGPSKFPVAKNAKRMASRDRAYAAITEHATAARKAVERRAWPHGHPDGPVRGSNPDAPEILRERIANAKAQQERMRDVNKAIRAAKPKTPDAQAEAVRLLTGWPWAICRKLIEPDFCGRVGFADYELTNNSANIRRMEQRLAVIENRREQGDRASEHNTTEGAVRVERDTTADRIKLIFPGKPSAKARDMLKSRGFRWSPTAGAWQRHLNNADIWAAECALKDLQNDTP